MRADAEQLGIELVSAASHPLAALWQKQSATIQEPGAGDAARIEAVRIALEHKIDAFLRQVGLDPAEATGGHEWRHIGFRSGLGLIGVFDLAGLVYLRVSADLMEVPSGTELAVALFRELLEINVSLIGPARGR